MKKYQKGKNLKRLLIFAVALAVVIFSTIVLLKILSPKTKKVEPQPTVKKSQEIKEQTSSELTPTPIEQSEKEDDIKTEKTPRQYEPSSEKSDKINASITFNSVNKNSNKYQLRIAIYEMVGNNGLCKLKMIPKNGNTIIREAKIIQSGANSASCEGFDIPLKDLVPGEYNLEIEIAFNNKTSKIADKIKI